MAKKRGAKKVNQKQRRPAGKPAPSGGGSAVKKSRKGVRWQSADYTLIVLTCALVIFGVIMVFSASYYWSIDKTGTPYHFLIRDVIFAGAGFVLMLICASLDYHVYKKWAPHFMVLAIVLLGMVFTPLGKTVNGATRWLDLKVITIMPGEIAKLAIIIFVAWFLSRDLRRIHDLFRGILPLLMLAGLTGLLIMKQPNMSTAMTIVMIVVAMMFVAGLDWIYVIGAVGLVVAAGVYLIFADGGYRLQRFTSFLDPFADPLGDGYQVCQGLMALGSGGFLGRGLGKSIQKNLYLPEPQNDFILAIIGEELGYIVFLILMLVYLFLIWRGIQIILGAPDRFGMLLGSGIVMMIGIQVLLNVAVVTSSMPPTGVTLPFISYGGNALWLFMGSMGILLNISRQSYAPKMGRRPEGSETAGGYGSLHSDPERDLSRIGATSTRHQRGY